MTEVEWLSWGNPQEMLMFVSRMASDRKVLLFACGCWRRSWRLLTDDQSRNAVRALEVIADGGTVEDQQLELTCCGGKSKQWMEFTPEDAEDALLLAFNTIDVVVSAEAMEAGQGDHEEQLRACCPLLRDIFGNPFRPVAFSPEWRTDTAVSLAKQMYDSRDFGAMPILADALQDADCDSDDILSHCRDAKQAHVRGCWVVDLVLGRE